MAQYLELWSVVLNLLIRAVAIFAAASLISFANISSAQAPAHPNAVELKRESASSVSFTFALNLPQVLHQVLAPQVAYGSFLQSYADLPDSAFDKEIAKAVKGLGAKAYFTLPSGAKVNIEKWQLPDTQLLRESFKVSLRLLNMPPSTGSHLDPVSVRAQAQAKTPISKVLQLQLPTALHPILVSLSNDKFWLTEHIPIAIVQLP